jgi:hypothetical protein
MPNCKLHPHTQLVCPSCIAAKNAGVTSKAKAKASARNGRLGGRPPKHIAGCGLHGFYLELSTLQIRAAADTSGAGKIVSAPGFHAGAISPPRNQIRIVLHSFQSIRDKEDCQESLGVTSRGFCSLWQILRRPPKRTEFTCRPILRAFTEVFRADRLLSLSLQMAESRHSEDARPGFLWSLRLNGLDGSWIGWRTSHKNAS